MIFIWRWRPLSEKNLRADSAFLFVAACILGIVLQKDLGSALHCLSFLFVYQISTNDWVITMAVAGAGALASIIGYKIFSCKGQGRSLEFWVGHRVAGTIADSMGSGWFADSAWAGKS